MKEEDQRIAIAEACGVADKWVLLKRGLYWRPDAKGYTDRVEDAWVITEAEADKYVYPHDEPVTKHRAPLPDYLNDLNAMHEAEMILDEDQCEEYDDHLCAVGLDDQNNYGHAAAEWRFNANAHQRAKAFLKTLNLWKD